MPGGTLRFFNASKALGCAVLEPALQAALTAVIELSREKPHIFVEYGHVELRAPDLRGRFGLCLAAQVERPDPTPLLEALARDQRVWLVGVAGAVDLPCQEFSPDGTLRVDVPLDAFWQINSEVNQLLVNAVVALALEHGAGAALDLYAGCGNFSLPLAARGLTVTAVERGASACRALARTAERSGFDVTAECSSVELACQRSYDDRRTFDFAILDAPRAGAERALLDLCGLAPRTIAVCSCNPKTLARDLATLVAAGYRLQRLTAFDMFPHTRHIETLACLQRG